MSNSDTDLHQLSQCFDLFLLGYSGKGSELLLESTFNSKKSIFTNQDCGSFKDSEVTLNCNKSNQQMDFQHFLFDNDDTIKFQKFLSEQDTIVKFSKQSNHHRSDYNYKKSKKYLPKHEACRTIFRYYGVDIQVRLKKAEDFTASALVIFYDKLQQRQLQGYINNPRLLKAILPKYKPKEEGQEENTEKMNYFFCQNYFRNKNYSHLYLIKKVGFKYMLQFSKAKLSQAVKYVLQSFLFYRKATTIVFKDFQWIGLEGYLKCVTFFEAIQQIIYDKYSKGEAKLRKITVCCENQQNYFQFITVLRNIGDNYTKNGYHSI